ncbi:MAG: TIGR01777 family oxidoreductase [Proteobacteria bacterium]|nr:TIGR01777 family oxidoreductase [Pseudomonadota bacterium]
MFAVFALITTQALLGAVDNLWHHEITERLPARRAAANELALHGVRELIYAFVFFGLAWFRWQGAWVVLIGVVMLAEVIITLLDFIVEDRTRRLPAFERVLHTTLALNFGAVLAMLGPVLIRWWAMPSRVIPVDYGPISWLFSVFGVGVFAWSLRNGLAVRKLRRPPEWSRNSILVGMKPAPRTVLISGATGFIGGHLVRRLLMRGDRVIVLTRDADNALDRFGPHVHIVTNLNDLDSDTDIDAIANLAGAPILGVPWTRARRAKLMGSRVNTTRALVRLMGRLARQPRVFISSSAIGYYGVRGNEWLDENSAPGAGFQSVLCREWESAAVAAEGLGVRVVRLRTGLVLGRDGGALPQLLMPVRLFAGAVSGSGNQWVSWIHIEDLVRLFELALDTPTLRGPINAVAPVAVTHRQFQRALARVLRRPLCLRVPAFILRTLLGEMAELLVDGQHVVPRRANEAGFQFRFRQLNVALVQLLGRHPGGISGIHQRGTLKLHPRCDN